MSVAIYHNPRCTKSRATLALLQERGMEPQVVEYLQHPPSAKELKHLLSLLGMQASDIIRKGEDEYKTLGLDRVTDEDALIAHMAAHPKLIERPIVVIGNQARIGRPPEKVLEIVP